MTPAAWLVAGRALLDRPWRSAVLLLGYGTGVAIMIALLSVGDALLLEARDHNLVAGGDIVVLPEGIDPAVVKVNGVTGLFLTLSNARFLVRDIIGGPRFAADVIAAAPQISSRLLYVRAHDRVVTASASAGIPSLDREARAARAVSGGSDSPSDRVWLNPSAASLADRLDRFHTPPPAPGPQAGPARPQAPWVEWDYFNVYDPKTHGYAYLTLITGADTLGGVLARLKMPGVSVHDILIPSVLGPGDISTTGAAQRVGPARISVDGAGYHVIVNDPRLRADLRIRPDRGFVLPATELRQGGTVTGYVVPMVRGLADGTIRAAGRTLTLSRAPAYHDHNWGTWRGITWEWGQAASTSGAFVYANVHLPAAEFPDGGGPRATLFLWRSAAVAASPGLDEGGLVAALPIADVTYEGWHPGPLVSGRRVPAPSTVTIHAASGADTATVRITVWDALGSAPPAGGSAARGTVRRIPIFLQLRGDAVVRGTIGGAPLGWQGPAASETFVGP